MVVFDSDKASFRKIGSRKKRDQTPYTKKKTKEKKKKKKKNGMGSNVRFA
jgi:hypothetical protein